MSGVKMVCPKCRAVTQSVPGLYVDRVEIVLCKDCLEFLSDDKNKPAVSSPPAKKDSSYLNTLQDRIANLLTGNKQERSAQAEAVLDFLKTNELLSE